MMTVHWTVWILPTASTLTLLGGTIAVTVGFGQSAELTSTVPTESPSGEGHASDLSASYCTTTIDKAAESRTAWQQETLQRLRNDVDTKIVELEHRRAELEEWIKRREEIIKSANRDLVDIYAKMDPEAAAAQLGEADIQTAVSILSQLTPRAAGSILGIMEPKRAAVLVKAMADIARDHRKANDS